jgi:hypothetical protein
VCARITVSHSASGIASSFDHAASPILKAMRVTAGRSELDHSSYARAHCEARLAFWPSFRSVARVTD